MSAALDGERPLAFWSAGAEGAWLLLWAALGSGLGLLARSPLRLSGLGAALLLALGGVCLALFRAGTWVPAVAPGLAAAGSAGLVLAEVEPSRTRTLHQRLAPAFASPGAALALLPIFTLAVSRRRRP